MNETEGRAPWLPLPNQLLFATDQVGLAAMSWFRQQWVLFFLAPPAMEGATRVPGLGTGRRWHRREGAGRGADFQRPVHRRLHRPADRMVERPDQQSLGETAAVHPC